MATWNSRGLRGSLLEELINRTNEKYREQQSGIDPEDSDANHAGENGSGNKKDYPAYFEHRSTVDYIGAVQGNSGLL